MKKLLVLFLALVMMLGALAACGPKGGGTDTPSGGSEYDEEAPLPRTTYNGKTYTVLYRKGQMYEEEWISDNSKRGNVINDAIAKRNQAVVDRYGVKLDYTSGQVSVAKFETDFWGKVTTTSTDDVYQLIAGQTYRLATVSVLGYCLNWLNEEQIPVVDTDADWWDGDFIRAAGYNNCVYIATGPLSLTDLHSSACMFFNKELLDTLRGSKVAAEYNSATDELFALVKSGGWTLDKLIEYSKDCTDKAEDTDEGAVYGLSTNWNNQIDAYIYSSNLKMTERKNGTIQLVPVNENSTRILTLASKLQSFHQTSGTVEMFGSGVNPERVYRFVSKNSVFCTGVLNSAGDIQNAPDILYGVIPYPKYDADQKDYYTYKVDYKTGFCIPRAVYNHKNQEFVGTITEALAYYSNKFVKPALYEKVLTHKNVQDKDSSDCVTIILNGGLYEFANIYAYAWGDEQSPAHLLRYIVEKPGTDFYTEYQGRKSLYQSGLRDLLSSFKSDDVSAAPTPAN